MPMGPFRVADMSGLDTVVKVARDMRDAYGDRFYVHRGMEERVDRGDLGAKTGKGFYEHLTSAVATADRFQLKALVEACLVLEEGVAGVRDIDLGMMMGTGMVPGPFARADFRGLDDVLAALERAEDEWGEGFEPPLVLRRLVAQGRLGAKAGQGFYPYPQPDEGYEGAPVKLDTRGDVAIVWLDNPPANSLAPDVIEALEQAWQAIEANAEVKAMILASPNPALFCAGADIKAFTKIDATGGKALLDRAHELLPQLGALADDDDRGGQRARARRRLRDRDGLRRPAGGLLGHLRAARDQPRDHPRLRRHAAAAAARRARQGARDEPTGESISAEDAYEHGLVNRVVPDHELFDAAIAWARKLARQAPLAVEQIKRVSHGADLDEGIDAEKEALRHRVRLRGRARGHRRLPAEADADASRGSDRAGAMTASPS